MLYRNKKTVKLQYKVSCQTSATLFLFSSAHQANHSLSDYKLYESHRGVLGFWGGRLASLLVVAGRCGALSL